MHIPVLLDEVIEFLNIKTAGVFIDATADGGGHLRAILEKLPLKGRLIGIDQDERMITRLKDEMKKDKRAEFINGNFRHIENLLEGYNGKVDGILFDLGYSSLQLELSGRGFSFQKDEPLLMTYKEKPGVEDLTAAQIVNNWNEKDIREIIKNYGEERYATKIAKRIVEARKKKRIVTTGELVEIIESALGKRGKIHPATKTFQALRVEVNDELNALQDGLSGAWNLLTKEGRLVVISFHSLEDRIVKNFMREKKHIGEGKVLTKKPIVPGYEEIKLNPRARSAKLRVIIKQ